MHVLAGKPAQGSPLVLVQPASAVAASRVVRGFHLDEAERVAFSSNEVNVAV